MIAISQTTFSNAFSWMKMFWVLIEISLKYVPWGRIGHNPPLVEIMGWHRTGDKPFSEPMTFQFTDALYASLSLNELNF